MDVYEYMEFVNSEYNEYGISTKTCTTLVCHRDSDEPEKAEARRECCELGGWEQGEPLSMFYHSACGDEMSETVIIHPKASKDKLLVVFTGEVKAAFVVNHKEDVKRILEQKTQIVYCVPFAFKSGGDAEVYDL